MADISSIPTAELPAIVEQGMPVADYIAEIERRKAEAMSDLVERLTYPEWTASKNYKAGEQGNPRLLDSKAPYEAAARITELEAEVNRLREALKPFGEYLAIASFDLDHEGKPLPDCQGMGWIYMTLGQFRLARTALSPTEEA